MAWNLDDYEPVEVRLEKFWQDNPDGQISTFLVHHDENQYIVRALIYRKAVRVLALDPAIQMSKASLTLFATPDATGFAHENVTDKGVNSTSALENCETSAIGRALANLGYAAKGKRPSREEMAKGSQNGETSSRPVTPDDRLEDGSFPQVCPDCGSDVWDNREKNDERQAEGKKRTPEYKCKRCVWLSWEQDAFRPGGAVDDTVTSLGVKVENVPIPNVDPWDILADMCQIFKAWDSDKRRDQAKLMVDSLGSPMDTPAEASRVFLKLSERYYADVPDEAPF